MYALQLSPRAVKDLDSLPRAIQQRILNKLRENAALDAPLVRAKPVVNLPPSTHRFRVGHYRVLFYLQAQTMFVERIQLRSRAYRRL